MRDGAHLATVTARARRRSGSALATRTHDHWRELFREVVDTGLCTGCSGCIVVCPRDVLIAGPDDLPVQIGHGMDRDECAIGDRGCDVCTRACPRFRTWEPELDTVVAGRPREPAEVFGPSRGLVLARATDPQVAAAGQDGGLVSALLV